MKSAPERRQALLKNMSALNAQNISCRACSGECCTSRLNSMQISRLEAEDLHAYLSSQGRITAELVSQLRACVRDYRLDVELPQHGSRKNLRRTYTCPFYNAGPRGCSISPEYKPYGCLAFNPTRAEAGGAADGCRSQQDLLLPLEETGSKKPIPLALLDLLEGM